MSLTDQRWISRFRIDSVKCGDDRLTVAYSRVNHKHDYCMVCGWSQQVLHTIKISSEVCVSSDACVSGEICNSCYDTAINMNTLRRLVWRLENQPPWQLDLPPWQLK